MQADPEQDYFFPRRMNCPCPHALCTLYNHDHIACACVYSLCAPCALKSHQLEAPGQRQRKETRGVCMRAHAAACYLAAAAAPSALRERQRQRQRLHLDVKIVKHAQKCTLVMLFGPSGPKCAHAPDAPTVTSTTKISPRSPAEHMRGRWMAADRLVTWSVWWVSVPKNFKMPAHKRMVSF